MTAKDTRSVALKCDAGKQGPNAAEYVGRCNVATAIGEIVKHPSLGKADAGFIRLRELTKRIPVSKSTIWLWVQEQKFPAPVKLSERVTAWSVASVEKWEAEKQRPAKAA